VNHFSGVNDLALRITTPSGSFSDLVAGGGLNLQTLATTGNGGVHLIVLKYEFRVGSLVPDPDVVSLFFDPISSVEPVGPDAQVAAPNSDLFITHQGGLSNFTFSGGGHVPGRFDEVRWGDTFADVVPPPIVPEPGSLALFGMAAGACCALRRRGGRS
jgi:hypothetical protein